MKPPSRNEAAERNARTLLGRALESGTARLEVQGNCMRPLIREGDHVKIVPLEQPIRPGAIVLLRTGADLLACHRLLEILPNGDLLIGGDAGNAESVSERNLLGRVQEVERAGRWINLGPGLMDRLLAGIRPLRRKGKWGRRLYTLVQRAQSAAWIFAKEAR